jgi:hypothetical protein
MIISKGVSIAATAAIALATMLPAAAQTTQPQNTNAMPPAQGEPAATVTLSENGKPGGTPGQAVLSQKGSDLVVTIKDPTGSSAPRSAMLYKGSCAGGAMASSGGAMSSNNGMPSSNSGTSSSTGGTSSSTGGTSSNTTTGSTTGSSTSGGTSANTGSGTYKLAPVTHGTSQTTLKGVKLSDITSGNYALAVGDSPRMCGELSQANPIPGTKQ